MRLMITGASGTLGRVTAAHTRQTDHVVFGTYRSTPQIGGGTAIQLDLTDTTATIQAVNEVQPDCILHLAVSDQTRPLEDSILRSTENITNAAQQVKARLVFMSTDMVFDGKSPPYSETAFPSPINPYGKAKAQAEQIAAQYENSLIVRTSLIYGFHRRNRQLGWMLNQIEARQPVTLFIDELRQPIYEHDLADALLRLAEHPATGIMHVVGPEVVSRADLGYTLLEAAGVDAKQHVVETRVHNHPNPRPERLILSTKRFKSVLPDFTLRTIREAAHHHLESS